jgi:hypothetical protein
VCPETKRPIMLITIVKVYIPQIKNYCCQHVCIAKTCSPNFARHFEDSHVSKVNNLNKSISIAILKKSAFQSLLRHLGRKPPVTQLIIYPTVRSIANGKLTFVGQVWNKSLHTISLPIKMCFRRKQGSSLWRLSCNHTAKESMWNLWWPRW